VAGGREDALRFEREAGSVASATRRGVKPSRLLHETGARRGHRPGRAQRRGRARAASRAPRPARRPRGRAAGRSAATLAARDGHGARSCPSMNPGAEAVSGADEDTAWRPRCTNGQRVDERCGRRHAVQGVRFQPRAVGLGEEWASPAATEPYSSPEAPPGLSLGGRGLFSGPRGRCSLRRGRSRGPRVGVEAAVLAALDSGAQRAVVCSAAVAIPGDRHAGRGTQPAAAATRPSRWWSRPNGRAPWASKRSCRRPSGRWRWRGSAASRSTVSATSARPTA
jgi:hypothetical protein